MKNSKLVNKFKKILITVLCIITVFFSMPVKAKADGGVLESVASFLLLIPDGINLILNAYVSGETEDVKQIVRVALKSDNDASLFTNNVGSLYYIAVTPYDIFTAGMPTLYGEYVEKKDQVESAIEQAGNQEIPLTDAVQAAKDEREIISEMLSEDGMSSYSTKSLVKMPILDANFFKKSTFGSSDSADILRPVVSAVYTNLRNIVLVVMLLILLYIGIRIVISSAVADQVKYKQYLVNWVVGICLVFLMQYIMSAIMSSTTLVNNMLAKNTDGDTYTIGFGTANSRALSNIKKASLPVAIATTWLTHSPLPGIAAGLILKNVGTGTDSDGWQKLADSDNTAIKNFVGRKLEIADSGLVFEFNKDDKTVLDYQSVYTGKPTKLNAAIYGKAENGFRAIYFCNIAEYCRTITTYSSKYTHIYSNNKTITMSNSEDEKENDSASAAFWGYTFLYLVITIETVVFLYKYLKRVIWLAFLTMIAPLIAVMYLVDKIGDGKAQTFNMWFKEYLFNALIQPLHLLLYTIFLGVSMDLMSNNVIYAIVAYGFMIPAEKFFKKMFGFDKASTPGGLGSPAAGMMAMRGLDKLGGFGPHGKGAKGGKDAGKTKIPLAKGKLGGGGLAPAGAAGTTGATPITATKTGAAGAIAGGVAAGSTPAGSASAGSGLGTGRLKSAGGVSSGTAKKSRLRGSRNPFTGMARAFGNRTAMRITGGKSPTLGQAFTTKAGLAGMAKNGVNFAARQVGRAAGGLGGAVVGLGVGAVSGALGTALTGEDKFSDAVQKGLLAGGAAGANRGSQFADWSTGGVEDLYSEGRRYAALDAEDKDQLERAARIKAEDWSQDHMSEISTLSASEYREKMEVAEKAFKYTDDIEDLDQLDRLQEYCSDASGNVDEDKLAEALEYEKITKRFGDFNVDAKKKDNYTTYRAREIEQAVKDGTFQFTQEEIDGINDAGKNDRERKELSDKGETDKANKRLLQVREKAIQGLARKYAEEEANIIARYQNV